MQKSGTQIWNAIPVLRLLLPLIAGILAEYYLSIAPHVIFTAVFTAAISLIVYRFLPVSKKFTWRWTKGLAISIIFISTGALLSYVKNQLHRPDWIGNYYTEKALLVATVQEPLVKKAKSFKALAKADFLIINNRVQPVSGNILLYFKKDSLQPELRYGSQIIISKPSAIPVTRGHLITANIVLLTAFIIKHSLPKKITISFQITIPTCLRYG